MPIIPPVQPAIARTISLTIFAFVIFLIARYAHQEFVLFVTLGIKQTLLKQNATLSVLTTVMFVKTPQLAQHARWAIYTILLSSSASSTVRLSTQTVTPARPLSYVAAVLLAIV